MALILAYAIAVLAAVALPSFGQQYDPERAEPVLIPVSVASVPGAYGTEWSTELWGRNGSQQDVFVFPLASSEWRPSRMTERLNVWPYPPWAPGVFLFVTKPGSELMQFDLRLFNRSDPNDTVGTPLPTPREREFTHSVNLLHIPVGGNLRTTLRIYSFVNEGRDGDPVILRVYSKNDALLAERELRMGNTLGGDPRFAAISSLSDEFAFLRGPQAFVRLEVVSASPSRIWAFVSAVSNADQRVTIISPQ